MKNGRFVLWMAVVLLAGSPLLKAVSQPDLVYYVGTDQHVHELLFGGTSWQTTDLMVATGATSSASGSALTGHVYGTSDNVYYIATDQHVHELAFYSGGWHTGDVTAAAGAPNTGTTSALTGHVYGTSDNVYFIATDGAVHELAFLWLSRYLAYAQRYGFVRST